MYKTFINCILSIISIIIFIIVFIYMKNYNFNTYKDNNESILSPDIILKDDNEFEEYLKGVVASEMPASYDIEALKAQAVASRTYAQRHIKNNSNISLKDIDQSYISIDEMKNRWGKDFETYYKKIEQAVNSTCNEIIIYDNEPIEAVFHAMSAGITENSEDVWKKDLPYLKSVESSFDKEYPDFEHKKSFNKEEFYNIINNNFPNIVLSNDLKKDIKILNYTKAGYIKNIQLGNKIIEASLFRKIFLLRSTNFNFNIKNDSIDFITKGYGHGVGMSQTGANFLAKNGYNYKDILNYYYKDTYISSI